jgi:hypothetical protein
MHAVRIPVLIMAASPVVRSGATCGEAGSGVTGSAPGRLLISSLRLILIFPLRKVEPQRQTPLDGNRLPTEARADGR